MSNKSKNHPLVITGASGFVGRNLLKLLGGSNVVVHALVRGNALNIPAADNIKIIKVSKYADHIPADGSVLIHLGEPSHVSNLESMGKEHFNAMSAQASALIDRGYDHIIYASSATVYDDNIDIELDPDSELLAGKNLYADTKIAVEKIISGAGGTIARITNIYGQGMSDINIFSDILNQLSDDGPLKIREATPLREYLWVMDLVNCLLAMAQSPSAGIYNISINQPISCEGLARTVLELAGQPDREIKPLRPPRNSVLRLDISKTSETFGWKPETSLEDGIKKLLEEKI